MAVIYGKIATVYLVGSETLLFDGAEGYKMASIKNYATSTTNVTLKGNSSIANIDSLEIPLTPGEEVTIADENGLDGVLVTIPSGATCKIVASKSLINSNGL